MPQDSPAQHPGAVTLSPVFQPHTNNANNRCFGSPGIQSFPLLYQAKDFPLDKPSFSHVTKFPKSGFF